MLKLKLQYFGHLMWRADLLERPWCWERLKAKGEGEDRGWDGWMASLTQQAWVWANSGRQWSTGKPSNGEAKSWTWLSNWTTTTVNTCMTSGGLWLFKPKWKEDWQVETEGLPWRQVYLRLILKTWSLPAPSVWRLKLAMCHSQRKHSSMFLVAVISIHILLVTGTTNMDCLFSIYLILHEVLLPQPVCFGVIIIRSDPHYSFLDSGNCFSLVSTPLFP